MKQIIQEQSIKIMYCTFKEIKECGHYEQCTAPVGKDKMDKLNFNNNYCVVHQKEVDEINKKRKQEANKKLKENINQWINDNQIDPTWKGVIDADSFQEKLNNGDFDA